MTTLAEPRTPGVLLTQTDWEAHKAAGGTRQQFLARWKSGPRTGIRFVDFFAGAGGSSQGLHAAGFEAELAANHWSVALKSHASNFEGANHFGGDLHDDHAVESMPYGEFFWASPACPTWSKARGKKRTFAHHATLLSELAAEERALYGEVEDLEDERKRALMWDVPRYLEAMRQRDGSIVLAGVVENVIDCRDWVRWEQWVAAFHNLGYKTRLIALNSMHARPIRTSWAPQSRNRLYFAYWHRSLGRDPDWNKWLRPAAHCPEHGQVAAVQSWKKPGNDMGTYGRHGQYTYRCPQVSCRNAIVEPGVMPAEVAIDWSIVAPRIGDRESLGMKRLEPKTLARIEAAIRRHQRPVHLEKSGNTYERPGSGYVRAWPTDEPFKTFHTSASKGVACPPLLVPAGGTWNDSASLVTELMRARTTRDTEALVIPPLVVPLRNHGVGQPADQAPFPTFAAGGYHHAVVMRNNTARGDAGYLATPVDEPLRSLTTAGHQSLLRWDHVVYAYDTGNARPIAAPLPTQTAVQGDALMLPQIPVEDCTFRMLTPEEIGLGMAFRNDYVVIGTGGQRTRQYGNAVTPPVAELLGLALREAITGEQLELGQVPA